MLNKFREAKQGEIARLRDNPMPKPWTGQRTDFATAMHCPGGISVIAEYKRASPSRGIIRNDLSVENVAVQYREAGAAAMSILTEEKYFQGKLDYLARSHEAVFGKLPLLRKDFIFDPLQVEESAATPASALLLIARMLRDAASLQRLREQAEGHNMAAVVEVFDLDDLRMAREAGASIIQVNARDLDTLQVSRQACLDLIAHAGPKAGETWIAASGISTPEHLAQARDAGFHAALVGTALMQASRPGDALAKLIGEI